MGKVLVLPSEIVTKAGSDFDIDKFYVYYRDYVYYTESGELSKLDRGLDLLNKKK